MSRLPPREWVSTHGSPAPATTAAMSGSARPPLTSFTSTAPASIAASATRALVVSTLTATPAAVSPATTGSTLRSSVAASTRAAPGLVDSPPTST
jgi:hypothetical protein